MVLCGVGGRPRSDRLRGAYATEGMHLVRSSSTPNHLVARPQGVQAVDGEVRMRPVSPDYSGGSRRMYPAAAGGRPRYLSPLVPFGEGEVQYGALSQGEPEA